MTFVQEQPAAYDVDVEDLVYRGDGKAPLLARLFMPRGPGPFAAVVDVHGGAWVQGDRTGNDAINLRLAQRGIVVLAVDHRLGPADVHPAAVQDVNYAVRWLKTNAQRLRTLPHWVGLSGTSAGGHLALLAALKPHDAAFSALELAAPQGHAHDALVAFCLALWPVICPARRYREVVLSGNSPLTHPDRPAGTTRQMAYWQTEAAMESGSPLAALQRGDVIARPPVLVVQSPDDGFHPVAHAREFVQTYTAQGGSAELHLVQGEPYYLVREKPDSPQGRAAIERMAAFVRVQLDLREL